MDMWKGKKYFDDFEIGDKLGPTRARTVTETDIVNFASLTGDWFQLHTDVEFAKKSMFGERIAHGMLVLSIASALAPPYDLAFLAFYGIDRVRFITPVKIGDTIHVEAEVIDKKEREGNTGTVTLRAYVKNQRDENVTVWDAKVLLAKRGKAA
jgi:3-hydroxybutyryl-CoA dehydratase